MALLSKEGKPLLIMALDRVEEVVQDVNEQTSAKGGEVGDGEREEQDAIIDRFLTSDGKLKSIRLPILIDDVIDVQLVGTNASTGKTVTYVDGEPKVNNLKNSVTIQLKIKNSVGDLSVAANVFIAIMDRIFSRYTTTARVSFFGHSVCIFNGYLTGYNRTTVGDTDIEMVNLTIERAVNDQEEDEKKDQQADNAGDPITVPNEEGGESFSNLSMFDVQASTANAGGSSAGKTFIWFKTEKLDDILNTPLPQIIGTKTINRLQYEIFKVQNKDFSGAERIAITLFYDGVYLPLGLNDHYPYYILPANNTLGYAVTIANDYLYLGVEQDAS